MQFKHLYIYYFICHNIYSSAKQLSGFTHLCHNAQPCRWPHYLLTQLCSCLWHLPCHWTMSEHHYTADTYTASPMPLMKEKKYLWVEFWKLLVLLFIFELFWYKNKLLLYKFVFVHFSTVADNVILIIIITIKVIIIIIQISILFYIWYIIMFFFLY